jgi:lipoyl(octanoyl) transferase
LIKVMVHNGDNRVLLLHRRPERGNFWQPITGSIEPGESPLEAARREMAEETGTAGEPEEIGLVQSFMIESQFLSSRYTAPVIVSEIGFAAHADGHIPIRMDAEEHDQYGWFTFEEAYGKIRWTDDREALEQLEMRIADRRSQVAG